MRYLFLLLLLAACGKSEPVPGAAGTSLPTPVPIPTIDGVEVKVDGKPLPVRTLLAYSRGGAALQLTLSNYRIECKDLSTRGTVLEPDEVTFDLTVAPRLGPDGDESWAVTRARLGRITHQGALGKAKVSAYDPRDQVRAELDAELTVPPEAGFAKASRIDIAAKVAVEGCGVLPWNSQASVRPQEQLVLTLAGKRIKIHGASLATEPGGRRTIRLSSEPHACSTGPVGSDYALILTLPPEGESASQVRIEGYSLRSQVGTKLEPGAVTARVAKAQGATALAELVGEIQVAGYPVTLSGTAALEVCRPAPGG